jgi:hypothetical protein
VGFEQKLRLRGHNPLVAHIPLHASNSGNGPHWPALQPHGRLIGFVIALPCNSCMALQAGAANRERAARERRGVGGGGLPHSGVRHYMFPPQQHICRRHGPRISAVEATWILESAEHLFSIFRRVWGWTRPCHAIIKQASGEGGVPKLYLPPGHCSSWLGRYSR